MLEFSKYISDATLEVFATMVFMDIEPGEPSGDTLGVDSNLTSIIGLAGGLKGLLAIHCPGDVARGVTGAMLGMDVEELDEDVKDAIGEVANMIAGGIKVSLAEHDRDVELAIPTTVIGTSIRTSGLAGASKVIVPFSTPAGRFEIEFKYVLA